MFFLFLAYEVSEIQCVSCAHSTSGRGAGPVRCPSSRVAGAAVHPLSRGASLLGPGHRGPQRSAGGRAGPCSRRGPTVPRSSSPVPVLPPSSGWTSASWQPHAPARFPVLTLPRSAGPAGAGSPASRGGPGVADGAEPPLQLRSQPGSGASIAGAGWKSPLLSQASSACVFALYLFGRVASILLWEFVSSRPCNTARRPPGFRRAGGCGSRADPPQTVYLDWLRVAGMCVSHTPSVCLPWWGCL